MSRQLTTVKPLTMKTVQIELAALSCHYPESGHTPKTLGVISKDWFEAFQELNEYQFKELIKEAKRKCRFFPKISDLSGEAEILKSKKAGDEYLFCGYCEGTITDCRETKGNEQKACKDFSYHATSPYGRRRLEGLKNEMSVKG